MSDAVLYDPYSYEIDLDPDPLYRRMRDEAPLYHNEELDFWALTRFQDNLDAFLDWQRFSSARSTVLEMMDSDIGGTMIIFMDPPTQTRYRNLVSKAFTPARIRDLAPRIREIAVGHLEPLAEREGFDVIGEFTAKLPMDVISSMLGIPDADRDVVRGWSNDVLHRDPGQALPPPRALEAMVKLGEYIEAQLDEREARPRDDMMTVLTTAELPGGQRLTRQEIVSFINLLATAGNETVTKLLATAYYWLWRFPDQREVLLADPTQIPGAVEETLRFDPPSHYQGRTLNADVELHGRVMPKGAKVLLINGASGRDERKFRDPERFDVRREIDVHLGLGYGRHVCLGASLARMESRIALEEFLTRFPAYEVLEDQIVRMHSSNVRGLAELPLQIS